MSISHYKVNSVAQYLSKCKEILKEWSDQSDGVPALWFRGQKDSSWDLIPGEFRFPFVNPDEIRSEFMLRAKALLKKDPTSDWEWYFLMQHFGLPTRLLDWTEGSLIGLHFALSNDTGEKDAVVWVLDPWELNQWSVNESDLVITGSEFKNNPISKNYLGPVYSVLKLPDKPIAIVPPFNSQRITVQRGKFTIHGSNTTGLDKQFQTKLVKIVIPKDNAIEIRRELRCVGISEFTLFPDLDGLCRDIRSIEVENC